jgi:hypothetical protein
VVAQVLQAHLVLHILTLQVGGRVWGGGERRDRGVG